MAPPSTAPAVLKVPQTSKDTPPPKKSSMARKYTSSQAASSSSPVKDVSIEAQMPLPNAMRRSVSFAEELNLAGSQQTRTAKGGSSAEKPQTPAATLQRIGASRPMVESPIPPPKRVGPSASQELRRSSSTTSLRQTTIIPPRLGISDVKNTPISTPPNRPAKKQPVKTPVRSSAIRESLSAQNSKSPGAASNRSATKSPPRVPIMISSDESSSASDTSGEDSDSDEEQKGPSAPESVLPQEKARSVTPRKTVKGASSDDEYGLQAISPGSYEVALARSSSPNMRRPRSESPDEKSTQPPITPFVAAKTALGAEETPAGALSTARTNGLSPGRDSRSPPRYMNGKGMSRTTSPRRSRESTASRHSPDVPRSSPPEVDNDDDAMDVDEQRVPDSPEIRESSAPALPNGVDNLDVDQSSHDSDGEEDEEDDEDVEDNDVTPRPRRAEDVKTPEQELHDRLQLQTHRNSSQYTPPRSSSQLPTPGATVSRTLQLSRPGTRKYPSLHDLNTFRPQYATNDLTVNKTRDPLAESRKQYEAGMSARNTPNLGTAVKSSFLQAATEDDEEEESSESDSSSDSSSDDDDDEKVEEKRVSPVRQSSGYVSSSDDDSDVDSSHPAAIYDIEPETAHPVSSLPNNKSNNLPPSTQSRAEEADIVAARRDLLAAIGDLDQSSQAVESTQTPTSAQRPPRSTAPDSRSAGGDVLGKKKEKKKGRFSFVGFAQGFGRSQG